MTPPSLMNSTMKRLKDGALRGTNKPKYGMKCNKNIAVLRVENYIELNPLNHNHAHKITRPEINHHFIQLSRCQEIPQQIFAINTQLDLAWENRTNIEN